MKHPYLFVALLLSIVMQGRAVSLGGEEERARTPPEQPAPEDPGLKDTPEPGPGAREGETRQKKGLRGDDSPGEIEKLELELRRMQAEVDRMLRQLELNRGRDPYRRRSWRQYFGPGDPFESFGPPLAPGRRIPLVPGPFMKKDGGRYRGKGLGVQIRAVDATLQAHLKLKRGQGVVINDVLEGSPASAGGLEPHDVILSFNGAAIAGQDPANVLIKAIATAPRGQVLVVLVIHRGERKRIEVILEKPLEIPSRGQKA